MLIMYSLFSLSVSVCVSACVCSLIVFSYKVSAPLYMHMFQHVFKSALQSAKQHFPTCKHANCLLLIQSLFAVLGECLQLNAWGGSFSLVISKRGEDKTAFVISIAPTGSICFITTKAKSVLSGKSCRHPENKTPNKWAKQQFSCCFRRIKKSWMTRVQTDGWMEKMKELGD